MPELPEVETIRRGLSEAILHKKIVSLEIRKDKLVKNDTAYFVSVLQNSRVLSIDRIGKLLIFALADKQNFLLVHLKMTGQLIYTKAGDIIAGGHNLAFSEGLPNKYSHIIFSFADGSNLFFNDMRQFGYMEIVADKAKVLDKFGIEPGKKDFTLENFKSIFKNKKITLKQLLLNQKLISGIGNIYADEICFRAGILPMRPANKLKFEDIKKIYQSCQYIIKKAVEKRGTTFSDYRDSSGREGNFVKYLKVYGRAGKKCLRCRQSNIKKVRLGGRGTHFCPSCQK
ncbi:bifunctional DNA-formamidopyrimidine glycosylase/DNA-(apurinic or apyrimidinic site) lyase [Candidatus Parcubacteria bacterium]|nr:MAG: bifunctional DNA-formamidopyrimidine glycosylase/DNA-(apurinic or apyrimidinic site) lyase [Candidatus Parcubacteria bacterium]